MSKDDLEELLRRLIKRHQESRPKRPQKSRKKSSQNLLIDLLLSIVATLATYRVLEEGEEERRRFSDLEKALFGDDKKLKSWFKLRERIQDFQEDQGVEIIHLGVTNAQPRVNRSEKTAETVQRWSSFVKECAEFAGEPIRPLIRIGCGPALTSYHVPNVLTQFRHARDQGAKNDKGITRDPCDIEIQDDRSRMRDLFKRSLLDFMITSFRKEPQDDGKRKFKGEYIQMRILFDRRYKGLPETLPKKLEEVKGCLSGMRIAYRSDYEIPADLIPSSAELVEVPSWEAGMSMTLSGGNVCCAAFPQFIHPRERCRFRELEMDKLPKMLLGVQRLVGRDGPAQASDDLLAELHEAFYEEIKHIANPENEFARVLTMRNTAHTTVDKTGQRCWMKGKLSRVVVTPEGFVEADHSLLRHWQNDETMDFTLRGHITKGRRANHVVWEAKETDREATGETYATEMVIPSREKKFAVGTWCGRATWSPDGGDRADLGWFVLLEEDLPLGELKSFLNRRVTEAMGTDVFDGKNIFKLPN